MTALIPMKITIRKKLILWYLEWKKFGSTPRFCKFHPRQMWCKPFLSPPKMCRFLAKQIVMWATFQSIGLQGCKKPVSSPTFGASSLNQGWHHAVFYYRVLFGFLIKPDSLRGSKIGFYSVLFPDKCFNAWLTSHARSGRPPIPATARTPTDIILLSVY
jgi:hypothetical protein